MVEQIIFYPQEQRRLYLRGILYSRWQRKYGKMTLFKEWRAVEATTRQIPVKSPPLKTQTYGFGELFAGIHYYKLGYEPSGDYRGKNWDSPSYFKAVEILGAKAAHFICRAHPQPPDLFVFDRKGRFFFVEAKLPKDRLNKNQVKFFRNIEAFLNKNMLQTKRAPHLPQGQWIEVAKLRPT